MAIDRLSSGPLRKIVPPVAATGCRRAYEGRSCAPTPRPSPGDMPHASSLIATIVGGIGLAFILGTITNRLRIPPLVGYLLAGVAALPLSPGFLAHEALALEL